MALNEGPVNDSSAPGLNYQNWAEFHSDTRKSNLSSIDILLQEEKDLGKSTGLGVPPASGNVELPERIRINSNHIIHLLGRLRGSNSSEDAPIIMFRPYKTLVFFDQDIRNTVTELEKKAHRTPAADSPRTSFSLSGDDFELAHLRCLIHFMDLHLRTRMRFLQQPECHTIFFSDLWLLYQPGDFVMSRDLCQAHQVIRVETKRRLVKHNGKFVMEDDSIVIHCVCIDFDGQWLGPVLRRVSVKAWGLSKHVESLELMPLTMAVAQKQAALKEDLIQRGQTFVQVARVSPMHYDGCTLDSKMQVNGTIVVDFQEALRDEENFKDWRSSIEHNLTDARIFATSFEGGDDETHLSISGHGNPHDDSYVDSMRYQAYMRSQLAVTESGDKIPPITISPRLLGQVGVVTEEELFIMNYRVFGYILDTGTLLTGGKWGVFDLSLASPMAAKSSVQFDDLVIPIHIKEIVRNLTTHHLKQMSARRIASGRAVIEKHEGQGLVLLLHGASSVGKKSTAESIARMAGIPLLHVSTELLLDEMRNDSTKKLEDSFTWAKRWGCIVMLNQADTILQGDADYGKGDMNGDMWDYVPQSILRRAVVRMLDTFTGITFLITDQQPFLRPDPLGSSGKEILSRINASFYYPPLDRSQTMKIFEINMRWINDVFSEQHRDRPQPASLVVDEDILEFAHAFYKQRSPWDRWNFMQIRKAFSTALALAQADAELMSPEPQPDDEPHQPWKVTLRASHFEVVVRSMPKSGLPAPPPPPPPPNQVGKKTSKYTNVSMQPSMAHAPPPPPPPGTYAYNQRPRQQLPQQPPPPPPQIPPPILLPNSRQLPPVEYRAQIPPPPPQPMPPPPPPPMQPYGGPIIVRSEAFFLSSPLSFEARPELLFLDWDAFKDARTKKGDDCSAIDVLKGEPVVSFDQEAQDSVWWSRWGDRNRKDEPRGATGAGAATVHKGTELADPQSSPLPERIRIHSKYITAILEEIHGSKISKTSFAMVRPFRALTYYEEKIRAKYDELVDNLDGKPHDREVEAAAGDSGSGEPPGDTTTDVQRPDDSSVDDDDGASAKRKSKPPRDEFSSIYSDSDDGETIDTSSKAAFQHLACLVEFIDMIRARSQYLLSGSCSKITFADVWHLFKPGDEVLHQEKRQAYRVLSVNSSSHRTLPPWKDFDSEQPEGGEPVIALQCVHITFDGEMLGSIRSTFAIVSFEGEADISTLPVLPLRLVKDPDSGATEDATGFRQDLIDRGRMFVRMAKSTPMHYNGPLLHPKEEVDSQVVIDFEQAFAFWARAPNFRRPVVEKLIGRPIGQPLIDIPCYASCCAGEHVYHDAYAEQKWNEAYIGALIPDPQDRTQKPSLAIFPRAIRDKTFEETELSDEDLVIMSYKVCGFVLRNRKWAQMDLKYLSPLNPGGRTRHVPHNILAGGNVTRNTNTTAETTLDQLVLPPGHKNIVKSLISQHFQDKATGRYEAEEKDVVRGKGKGLIILLHGAPGVGKTSTAEGVAEAFNKPLFQITSGDLGTNAKELEDALEWHFYLAHKWDCVLLLDEADVFLSVRSPEDFQRNSLVAVFLRVLEYYAGVLFLTTNRIGDFDEAFSSRIHISLYYPPLKRSSTRKIFDLNLRNIQQRIEERGVEIEVEHDQIINWAVDYWRRNKKMRWNGRQIRNACQTALALAEYDAQHPTGSAPDEPAGQEEGTVETTAKIKLTIGHLETVAKAYLEFMRYLHEIYGKDAERRAKAMGIRAREFSMKNWAASQEPPPQEDDDDEESEDEATGLEAAQNKKAASQQGSEQALDKGKSAAEASTSSPAPQNPPFPGVPFPYPQFPMPNMHNPYAVPTPFGQTQQPQASPYQQTADQQRQFFASMAAWNNMMPGGQPVPFPGMAGMPAQVQGGAQPQGGSPMQGGTAFPPGSGTGNM